MLNLQMAATCSQLRQSSGRFTNPYSSKCEVLLYPCCKAKELITWSQVEAAASQYKPLVFLTLTVSVYSAAQTVCVCFQPCSLKQLLLLSATSRVQVTSRPLQEQERPSLLK